MKIVIEPDCGNSPKMAFIKQFNIAFATADAAFLLESVTDDFVWHITAQQTIEGKSSFHAALEEMLEVKLAEFVVENILTHGKKGAASGTIKHANGARYAFSDFYEFSSAKGTKVTSSPI